MRTFIKRKDRRKKDFKTIILLGIIVGLTIFNTNHILKNSQKIVYKDSTEYIPTNLEQAVVEIVSNNRHYGSGTVIHATKESAYILTAAHVVSERKATLNSKGIPSYTSAEALDIKIGIEEKKIEIKAYILAINYKTDLAILRVLKDLKVKPVPIANMSPNLGEVVWSITNPSHLERMYLKGIISRKTKKHNTVNLAGVFGASGGMIINTKGELFGVFSILSITKINGMFPSATIYNHSPKLKDIKAIIKKAGIKL